MNVRGVGVAETLAIIDAVIIAAAAVIGAGVWTHFARNRKTRADTEATLVETREKVIQAQADKITEQAERLRKQADEIAALRAQINELERTVTDLGHRLRVCEERWAAQDACPVAS